MQNNIKYSKQKAFLEKHNNYIESQNKELDKVKDKINKRIAKLQSISNQKKVQLVEMEKKQKTNWQNLLQEDIWSLGKIKFNMKSRF